MRIEGKLTSPNKDTYIGQFVNNTKQGQGVMLYANGDKFQGDWYQDQRHEGKITFASGAKYEGRFVNDNEHGQGTYMFPNGDLYVGLFNNGDRHGHGRLTETHNGKKVNIEGNFTRN